MWLVLTLDDREVAHVWQGEAVDATSAIAQAEAKHREVEPPPAYLFPGNHPPLQLDVLLCAQLPTPAVVTHLYNEPVTPA